MLTVHLDSHQGPFHLSLEFSAHSGQTTVILGESGAGKSTMLRHIAGLANAEKGTIIFNNVTYYDSTRRIAIPPQQRPFGYVFQDYILFPHLNVFENIAFGLRAQRQPKKLIQQRVAEALEQVHLQGLAERHPGQLSGGQQQRVALARALALHPELLLLDEPLSALDIQTRREVRQELRQILKETHLTTIMVTHHYLDSLLFGDQILVLDQGKVIQQGKQEYLQEYPRSSYIAELVETNFFRGHIIRYEGSNTCHIQIHTQTKTEAQPLIIIATLKEQAKEEQQTQPALNSEAYIVVDPGSITIYQEEPVSSARNIIRGHIQQIIPHGNNNGTVRISMSIEQTGGLLSAEITRESLQRMSLQEGDLVFASFKATEANAYT